MISNIEYKKKHYSSLNELQKRHYLGLLAVEIGYHGVSEVSNSFGVHRHTVRRSKKEILAAPTDGFRFLKPLIIKVLEYKKALALP